MWTETRRPVAGHFPFSGRTGVRDVDLLKSDGTHERSLRGSSNSDVFNGVEFPEVSMRSVQFRMLKCVLMRGSFTSMLLLLAGGCAVQQPEPKSLATNIPVAV